MKGNGNVKKSILVVAILVTLLASLAIMLVPSVQEYVEPLKTAETALANTTENRHDFKLASEKVNGIFTFEKQNAGRSLNIFCAQHGAHADQWAWYPYEEIIWDASSGIWKNEDSYKKITWIKDNFWESTNASDSKNYTYNEKLAILNTVDKSITIDEVKKVFGNANNKFTLYQLIVWNYTNGKTESLSGKDATVVKVYNAINKLADKYYNSKQSFTINASKDVVWNSANKTYSWDVTLTNTYPLPYDKSNNGNSSFKLVVDDKTYTNYTYDGKTIVIKGLENGDHSFYVSAYTYVTKCDASIWVNSYWQNLIELTKSTKVPVPVSAKATTSKTIDNGEFNVNVLKVDENNNPVENVVFDVNGTEYTTNNSGIANVVINKEVSETDEQFEYIISEVTTSDKYLKLNNPISIVLTTGFRTVNGVTYYSIVNAYFKDNNSTTIVAETENNKEVALSLNLTNNVGTTTVEVVVPNKEKVYDLALTKSIVIPDKSLLEEYDITRDGVVDVIDSTCYIQLNVALTENKTVTDFLKEAVNVQLNEQYDLYYKDFSEEELKDILASNSTEALQKSTTIMNIYASLSMNQDQDRIESIVSSVINQQTDEGVNTTAKYYLNKSAYAVEVTDEIVYKITVYNEGDYASKDITITDYLPKGLVVCDVQAGTSTFNYKSKDYTWTVDEANNTASITIQDVLEGYNGKSLKSANVYIKCKIDEEMLKSGDINYDDILYNVAEITSSQPIDSEGNNVTGVEDRDSDENTIVSDTANNVIDGYTDRFETVENEDGNNASYIEKSKYDYEDDDDFERIIIKEDLRVFDLSLRKSITKIGSGETTMTDVTSQYTYDEENTGLGNRLPVIDEVSNSKCIATGTGLYYHPKEVVLVRTGDFVEYSIRVFNEGGREDYAGYASQITDYLPEGLEFYAVVDNNGKWISTAENGVYKTTVDDYYGGYEVKYDSENNKVVLDYKGSLVLKTKKYLYDIVKMNDLGLEAFGYYNPAPVEEADTVNGISNEKRYVYQEVKLICKVTSTIDSKKLTNLAEITGYVAINSDGTVATDVADRDSSPNVTITSKTDMANNEVNLDAYYNDRGVNDTFISYYAGCEDDDDFETVMVKVINGKYTLKIKKIDSISNDVINGATFKVNNETTQPTVDGVVTVINKEYNNTNINEVDSYTISEININSETEYIKLKEPITVYVKKSIVKVDEGGVETEVCKVSEVSFEQNSIVNSKEVSLEDDTKVTVTLSVNEDVIEVTIPNKPTGFDLALRKFISKVNGEKLEKSREPWVVTEQLAKGESTTAEYQHPKNAVLVKPKDIVQYTIRIYNEGSLDGYATTIMDDVPEGVEMVAPTYDEDGKPTNLNAEYGWVMYKEYVEEEDKDKHTDAIRYNEKMYIRTENAEEAAFIVTDYLSKANGEAMMSEEDKVNPNLIEAYNKTEDILSYKDIQIEFKVKPSNEANKEIINYAQITDDSDENGNPVIDRDSTPNVWEESPRDDDQDTESIKVEYFDLALYKWVTTTIVTEDGKTKEYASEHTQDDKSKAVNVTIPKDKLDETIVKFKYTIKVENQGNLAGYAKEIKDHIPEGLKFVAEDNIKYGWILEEDGTITTDYLKDTLLQHGETAEVEVVLTWINGENNLGEKWNFAEISEDYNDYGAPDIDSTPDNFEDEVKEDDEDKDVVMLNVRTGAATIIYAVLGMAVMVIITGGVVGIKKFVL